MSELIWPNYYPEHCPPKEASALDSTVFRLCKNNPPSNNDFIPYVILYPERNFIGQECQSCGVSVYNDIEDIKSLRKIHKGLRKQYICSGQITQKTGLALATPVKGNSHTTWWIASGRKPNELFEASAGE